MTSYSDLIKEKRIKEGKYSKKQIDDCLNLARRDIRTARKLLSDNTDWAFNIAYNAMLQAARAFMFSRGFRATGERQHATTIQFAQITLGEKFESTFEFMERMRRKRHKAVYDTAGLISIKEATEAIDVAEIFVSRISEMLRD